jgi:hypothetical protein
LEAAEMASTTEIIHDASAFIRSTVTTVVAFTLGLAGLTGALIALDIVPEDKKALLVGVNAALVVITSAGRQIIAWLDKNNTSFGRVEVEVDPGADEPGDSDVVPEGETVATEEPLPPTEVDIDEDEAYVPPVDPEGGQD